MITKSPSKDELLAAEVMAERELASILREAVDKSNLDRQEIARRLGVHRSNVSKILNSPRNLTVRMAARMLRAAGARFAFATVPVVCGQTHAEGLRSLGVAVLNDTRMRTRTEGASNRTSVSTTSTVKAINNQVAI